MVRLQLYIHNEYNRDIIAADVRQHQQPLQPDRAHGLRAVPEPGRVLALARGGGRGGGGPAGGGLQLQQVHAAARRHRGDRQGHPAHLRRQQVQRRAAQARHRARAHPRQGGAHGGRAVRTPVNSVLLNTARV